MIDLPLDYLNTYYTKMDAENKTALNFLKYVPIKENSQILDYGCGASFLVSAGLQDKAQYIDLAEADPAVLLEAYKFKLNKSAFDWSEVFRYANTSLQKIQSKLRNFYLSKLPASFPQYYDAVINYYCLDMASHSWKEFDFFYQSLRNTVKPGGWLITGLVTGKNGPIPGENEYPSLSITREEFLSRHTPDILHYIKACDNRGYTGMLYAAEYIA